MREKRSDGEIREGRIRVGCVMKEEGESERKGEELGV